MTVYLIVTMYALLGPSVSSAKTAREACAIAAIGYESFVQKAKISKKGRILWTKPVKCFVGAEE